MVQQDYETLAKKMGAYLARESAEHLAAGGSVPALESFCASYIQFNLEGRGSEEQARDFAHRMTSQDVKREAF